MALARLADAPRFRRAEVRTVGNDLLCRWTRA
jgi:hypothetical protein